MFEIGDIVSVKTEIIDGFPHAKNSIGGYFPVNRNYYQIVADLGNNIYVIGIGNLAIAAVNCDTLRVEHVESAWVEPAHISGVVRIRDGARNYMGYPLPSYVYTQDYSIMSISYDRILLSNKKQVIAIKGEDIV